MTFLFRGKKKWLSVSALIGTLLLLLIYIFINEHAQFIQSTYTKSAVHVFDRASPVLVLTFSILVSLAASYLIRDHIFAGLFESLYDYFASQVKNNPAEYVLKILNNHSIFFHGELQLLKEK